MNTSIARLCKATLTAVALFAGLMITSEAKGQQGYYAAAYPAQAMQRQAYPYGYAVPAARAVAYVRPQAQAARPAMAAPAASNFLSFNGTFAAAPAHLPAQVQYAVAAGNQLQNKPYQRGGGHRSVNDRAYDCSGSVSYTLINAGLLARPLSSSEFANFGAPGPGRYITIYVKPGEHVFMSICGLRLDTTGGSEGQGPRWRPTARSTSGFIMRHPFGL